MPFGTPKDQKTVSLVAIALAGLVLVFGNVPLLNLSVVTPLFFGITVGTLLGVILLYAAWRMWKGLA